MGLILAILLAAKQWRARNWAYVLGAVMPLAWLAAPLLAAAHVRGVVKPQIIWCNVGQWQCYLDELVRVFTRLNRFNPLWYMVPLTFLYFLFLLFLRKGVIGKKEDQLDSGRARSCAPCLALPVLLM